MHSNNNKKQSFGRNSSTGPIKNNNSITTINKNTSSLKELKTLRKRPLPIKCDVVDLQQIILAIRNNDAKVHKVMTELLPSHIDKNIINVDYINSIMRSICNQLDCIKLDQSVSIEDTINAFRTYVKISQEYYVDNNIELPEEADSEVISEDIATVSITTTNRSINSTPIEIADIVENEEMVVSELDNITIQNVGIKPVIPNHCASKVTSENNVTVITAIPLKTTSLLSQNQQDQVEDIGLEDRNKNLRENNKNKSDHNTSISIVGPAIIVNISQEKMSGINQNIEQPNCNINSTALAHVNHTNVHSSSNRSRNDDMIENTIYIDENLPIKSSEELLAVNNEYHTIYNTTTTSTNPVMQRNTPTPPSVPVSASVSTSSTNNPTTTEQQIHLTNQLVTVSSLAELYYHCWERLIKLFIYVNDRHRSCLEALYIIEDIIISVEDYGVENLSTPILAITLDTIIQQAINLLVDKVSYIFKTIPKINQSSREYVESEVSVDNIEACISISYKLVIPICNRIQEHFHTVTVPNLPYPTGGNNNWCNKLTSLCNKLQDLLVWCGKNNSYRKNIDNNSRIPSTFPFICNNVMIPIESTKDVVKNNVQQSNNENDNNIEYFYQQHPEILSDNVSIIDDTLVLTLKEYSALDALVPIELVKHVQQKLYSIVYSNISTEISLSVCGSSILGLPNITNKNEVDYLLAVGYQYSSNIYEWPLSQQVKELDQISLLNDEKMNIQYTLDSDLTQYNAIQQIHSILKELDDMIVEYVNKLNLSESPSHHALQIIDDLLIDKRNFIQFAQKAIRCFEDEHLQKLIEKPTIPKLIQRLDSVQKNNLEEENKRTSYIKKTLKSLNKTLKDSGYPEVNMISNRSRFLRLNYIHTQTQNLQLSCNIILAEVIVLQTTKLIRAYLDLDPTQKIHSFMHMIKIFVNSHNLVDMCNGLLSMTGWYILAIHFLLHFEYLPNIHMDEMYLNKDTLINKLNKHSQLQQQDIPQPYPIDISKSFLKNLPSTYKQRIDNVSIVELFDGFLRYYVEQFNIYGSVVTLRGKGLVLSKCHWEKEAVLWRLSIEDPFDCMHSSKPFDLGKSLSKNGQVTIFKALKRAIHGIRTILVSDMSNCQSNVKKLFSKQDLIQISRQVNSNGSTGPGININASDPTNSLFTWLNEKKQQRRSDVTTITNVIDMKEYKYYEFQMYLHVTEKYFNAVSSNRSNNSLSNTVGPSNDYSREDLKQLPPPPHTHSALNTRNSSVSRGLNANSKPYQTPSYSNSNINSNMIHPNQDSISTARTSASSIPPTFSSTSSLSSSIEPQIQKRIIRYRDAESNQVHTRLIHIKVDPSVIRYQQSTPTVIHQQQPPPPTVIHPQPSMMGYPSKSTMHSTGGGKISGSSVGLYPPPPVAMVPPNKNLPPKVKNFDLEDLKYNNRSNGSKQQYYSENDKYGNMQQFRDTNEKDYQRYEPQQQQQQQRQSNSFYSFHENATNGSSMQSTVPYESIMMSARGSEQEPTPRSNTNASTTTTAADHSSTITTTVNATSNHKNHYFAPNAASAVASSSFSDHRILNIDTTSTTATTSAMHHNDITKKSSPIVPKISLAGITSKQMTAQYSSELDNNEIDLNGDSYSTGRQLYTDRSSLSASSPRQQFEITPRLLSSSNNLSSNQHHPHRDSNTYNNQYSENHLTANYNRSLNHNYPQQQYRNNNDVDRYGIEDNQKDSLLNRISVDHSLSSRRKDNDFSLHSFDDYFSTLPYKNNNSDSNSLENLLKPSKQQQQQQSYTSKYSLDDLLLNQNVSSNDFDDVLKQYEYNHQNNTMENHHTKDILQSLNTFLPVSSNLKFSSIASSSTSSNQKNSKSSQEYLDSSQYNHNNASRLNSIIDINPTVDYSPRSFYSTGLSEESNNSKINSITDPLDTLISYSDYSNTNMMYNNNNNHNNNNNNNNNNEH